MTSLWRNFSGNVVANSKWRCLLTFASEVHWRVQPIAARWSGRFNQMQRCHMSVNNASMRTVSKWLKRNNGHLITVQIWMPWRYHVWVHMKLFLNFHLKWKTVSESRTGEDMGQFCADSIIKAVPSFKNLPVWQKYMNGDGRHSEHVIYSKNV